MSATSMSAKVCGDCQGYYWNLQAHAEECPGSLPEAEGRTRVGRRSREAREEPLGANPGTPSASEREFTGWYSCGCPGHGWTRDGGRCENMRDRRPVYRPEAR